MLKHSLLCAGLIGISVSSPLMCMEKFDLSVNYSWYTNPYDGVVTHEFPIHTSSRQGDLGKNLFEVLPVRKKYQDKIRTRLSSAVHTDLKKNIHFRYKHKKYVARIYPQLLTDRGDRLLMIHVREQINQKE